MIIGLLLVDPLCTGYLLTLDQRVILPLFLVVEVIELLEGLFVVVCGGLPALFGGLSTLLASDIHSDELLLDLHETLLTVPPGDRSLLLPQHPPLFTLLRHSVGLLVLFVASLLSAALPVQVLLQ